MSGPHPVERAPVPQQEGSDPSAAERVAELAPAEKQPAAEQPTSPNPGPGALRRAQSMVRRLGRAVHDVAWEPVSPLPLAAFRIAFTLVLMAEFLYCVNRRQLFFLESPITQTISAEVTVDLWIWFFALVACLVGFLTPIAACVSYFFVTKYFSCDGYFVYHADMIYLPASLLLIIMPANRCASVDRWLVSKLFRIDLARYPVPRLFSNVAIYWAMAFVYFDSTLYKLEAPFWRDGLGFWLPASFPSFTTISWNFLLNQRLMMEFAGYLTLLFELSFIFLFWIARARKYLFVLGLAVHLGIAIVLPIPLFGLLMMVHYLLFFPDQSLNRTLDFLWSGLSRLPGLASRPSSSVTPSAQLRAPAGPFLALDVGLGQLLLIVALAVSVAQAGDTFRLPIFTAQTRHWLRNHAGITNHNIFGHRQFDAMTQELALVYYSADGQETWLPWVKRDGHIGLGAYGRFWTFWWIQSLPRMGNPAAWARVAEEWAHNQSINLESGQVVAKVRPVINTPTWEKDRHRTMEGIPWSDRLIMRWKDGKRVFAPPR